MPATPWGTASSLLEQAGVGEDPAYYRGYTGEDERAALTVPMRIQAAWAANDADAFADTFTGDGSLLMRDTQLTSREQIRAYMAEGFRGPLKGARVKGWPINITFLSEDVAMVVTEGGIIRPGAGGIAPEDLIRATWIILRRPDGRLSLVSHQSSPVKG